MSHLSGLTREPPVGHYFDTSAPTLAATVGQSQRDRAGVCTETHTKSSNAGIAVAGYVLTGEKAAFRDVKLAVLDAAGMRDSSLSLFRRRRSCGHDGPSPPPIWLDDAGGELVYATGDLAKFVSVLFAGRRGLLRPGHTGSRCGSRSSTKKASDSGFACLIRRPPARRARRRDLPVRDRSERAS